ncbi:family 1 glycosylhydrolase [Streptomyces sp. NPDC059991]|uniref:family 1 glycosylhydrolase n=1 Tax=Streptomyces sp. NPDC059991 TaxID=3347028 RepID=UPI00368AE073
MPRTARATPNCAPPWTSASPSRTRTVPGSPPWAGPSSRPRSPSCSATSTPATRGSRYPRLPPLWITENGSAEADSVAPDGRVHHAERIDYLAGHLAAAVADAVEAGVDVRGYYVWSLLDNFEWARGYGQRFGLVHVDHDTLTRTPKDSYRWHRGLITAHRARTEEPAR